MLKLAVAFGADADHVRHDRADRRLRACGLVFFRQRTRGVRQMLHATVSDHDALGNSLFRRGQQTLVEPNSVCTRHLVETVSNFRRIETTAQHLRSQQSHAATDWTGSKHFLNHLAIVIDGDVEVLTVKGNLPGGAAQFARTLDAYRC
jgi:hypothetical protein